MKWAYRRLIFTLKSIQQMVVKLKYLFYLLPFVTLVFSCAKVMHDEVPKEKLHRRKTVQLLDVLDSIASRKPERLFTRISTDYQDTNRNISFKTTLRMKSDSAMNMTITFLKIPIVNALINQDSIFIVNKKDKCYIKNSLGYIKENFGLDFAYKNLEELFLGLPLAYDTAQKYFQIHDPYRYTISSHRKWEMKRIDRKHKEEVVIKYFLNDSVTELEGMEIESPSDSTLIQVNYRSKELVGPFLLPKEMSVDITSPKNHIKLFLNYEKVDIKEQHEIFIVIPESYEACE